MTHSGKIVWRITKLRGIHNLLFDDIDEGERFLEGKRLMPDHVLIVLADRLCLPDRYLVNLQRKWSQNVKHLPKNIKTL